MSNVEVKQGSPQNVTVTQQGPNNLDAVTRPTSLQAGTGGVQGPSGPQNLVVGPTNTLTQPGLWIQTGLGNDGTGFTFWIEDGQL